MKSKPEGGGEEMSARLRGASPSYVDIDYGELVEYLERRRVSAPRYESPRDPVTSNASSLLVISAHLACNEGGIIGSTRDPKSWSSASANARATSGSFSGPSTANSAPVSRLCIAQLERRRR